MIFFLGRAVAFYLVRDLYGCNEYSISLRSMLFIAGFRLMIAGGMSIHFNINDTYKRMDNMELNWPLNTYLQITFFEKSYYFCILFNFELSNIINFIILINRCFLLFGVCCVFINVMFIVGRFFGSQISSFYRYFNTGPLYCRCIIRTIFWLYISSTLKIM